MKAEQTNEFTLGIGQDLEGKEWKYELRNKKSTNPKETPFIIAKKGSADQVQANDPIFIKFLARVQIVVNAVPNLIRDKYG